MNPAIRIYGQAGQRLNQRIATSNSCWQTTQGRRKRCDGWSSGFYIRQVGWWSYVTAPARLSQLQDGNNHRHHTR
jgi:hypothetical protein